MTAPTRSANHAETHSRAAYLRTLASQPLLDREQERQHALELREARRSLCALFLELPSRVGDALGEAAPPDPERATEWPLDRLDTYLDRLADYSATHVDETVERVLARCRPEKKCLDRARDALVRSNLRLVPHVVRQIAGSGNPFLDLVQEGNLGLLRAVDRFDPDRGFRFSTYAFWWIRRALSDAFAGSSRLIRLPANVLAEMRELSSARKELERTLGRAPDEGELAERLVVPVERVRGLLELGSDPLSLDGSGPDRPGPEPLLQVADDLTPSPLQTTLAREAHRRVRSALEVLSPRERQIVRLRFGIQQRRGHSLREVGALLGLSRERVRQIEVEALARIERWTAASA